MSMPRWTRHGLALATIGLLLVGCGRGQATATPSPATVGVGCFLELQVAPSTASPAVTAAQAETSARAAYDAPTPAQQGRLEALEDARLVTVLASGSRANGQDALRGQEVWLLVFAYRPADQPVPCGNSIQPERGA